MQGMIDDFFSWLNGNSSALTMIFTLVLAVATVALAYVSYLQVKASNRQISESRLIRKIEKHNEQLRNLFHFWWEYLPRPPETGFEVYDLLPAIFEEDPLFTDLEKHFPPRFKDLLKKWEYYKDLRQKYHQKQKEIVDKITDLISNKQKEAAGYDFPPLSVYLKAIELLTDKKYYDYIDEIRVYAEPTTYRLKYERIGGGIGFQLSRESIGYTKEEINKLKGQHENVSNIVKKEYEKDIKTLIDIEGELKEIFREFKVSLNKITRYPEYNNMVCEYIFPQN